MRTIDLSTFNNSRFDRGKPLWVVVFWQFISLLVVRNPLNPSSAMRAFTLRLFGASIGRGVVLRPGLRVKFPWRLRIGDHSWIGEDVWLDCLDRVEIGANVCVSQGAYFCTGNHDWSDPAFALRTAPITVLDGAWVGAQSCVLPGRTVGRNAILCAGSVLFENAMEGRIYQGNPARDIGDRKIRE